MNMSAENGLYEVYAIRYARLERTRKENFVGVDEHDGPMPLAFYVWLLRSPQRTVLVDTGFSPEGARARGRTIDRCPIEALSAFGIDPSTITDVVVTHLHWDHAGNFAKLPNARFHLQDAEMEYATGRCMCHELLRRPYSVDDVTELVRKVYAERVIFHVGAATIAPGIELRLIGGHTRGMQAVRVCTARGNVVLASDASHFYENFETGRPFVLVEDIGKMLEGHRVLREMADSDDHIVPGHDPDVLRRYPPFAGDDAIACLHLPPHRG